MCTSFVLVLNGNSTLLSSYSVELATGRIMEVVPLEPGDSQIYC